MLFTDKSLLTTESETLLWETLARAYEAIHEHERGAANLYISDIVKQRKNSDLKKMCGEVLRRMKSAEPPKTELVNPDQLKRGDRFYIPPRILCIAARHNDILGDKELVGVVIDDPARKTEGFRFLIGVPVQRVIP